MGLAGEEFYWQEFGKTCELSLDIQKAGEPKVEVREGQVSVKVIKEAHDIVDVISHYTRLRKAGKEYIGRCPFHQDNNPSLQVNQLKQVFYCFSCKQKGDLINFIMQIEGLDTKQACLFLRTLSSGISASAVI
ncbi:MAG: CHC2 zinc finger domain-containing protein [Dehalococcoidales bacterium]|nr:CHC2 zinc finger domain-containing protein [Dehalococcoidales bacterium]